MSGIDPGARQALMELLHEYARQLLPSEDPSAVERTMRFVAEHDDCLLRSCIPGHLTGSAWVVNSARNRTLLTHHRKLQKWLQLGGHADSDADLAAVAMREAREESGLTRLRLISAQLFDVDVHRIPARKSDPEHDHFDLRFLIEADESEPLVISHESKDLQWVELAQVTELNPESSMARMVLKTSARLAG